MKHLPSQVSFEPSRRPIITPKRNPFRSMPKGALRYFIDYLTTTNRKYLLSLPANDSASIKRLLAMARQAYQKYATQELSETVKLPDTLSPESKAKIKTFLKNLSK